MKPQGKKNDDKGKSNEGLLRTLSNYRDVTKLYQNKNDAINRASEMIKSKPTEQKNMLINKPFVTKREEETHHDEQNRMRDQKYRELEQKSREYEQRLEQSQKEKGQLVQQNKVLKVKLTEKQNIVARNQQIYDNLLNKYYNQKKQIESNKKSINSLTKQLKNIVSKMQTKNAYDDGYKTRRIETLQKIITLNDEMAKESGEWNEKEKKLRDVTVLSENQKSQIQLLLQKIVEKEDFYQKFILKDPEQYKEQEKQRQNITQLYDKIENTLRTWKEIEVGLYQNCSKINQENKLLRQQIKQAQRIQADSIMKIKRYDQQIKDLIKLFKEEKIAEKKRENQQQLKSEFLSKMELQEKQIKAKQTEIQTLKNKIANLEKDSQEMKQKISLAGRSKLTFSRLSGHRQIEQHQQQSPQLISKRFWLLGASELLYQKSQIIKRIIEKIEKSSRKIVRTRQMFKKNEHSHNFGIYLKETLQLPYLLLLIKVTDNKFIGAYTDEFRIQGDVRNGQFTAFIFTSVDGRNVKFFDKTSQKPQTIKSAVYSDNSLIFGNRELIVKNCIRERQITWNMSIFGKKYYDYKGDLGTDFLKEGSSKLTYQEMEMHIIDFTNIDTSSTIRK